MLLRSGRGLRERVRPHRRHEQQQGRGWSGQAAAQEWPDVGSGRQVHRAGTAPPRVRPGLVAKRRHEPRPREPRRRRPIADGSPQVEQRQGERVVQVDPELAAERRALGGQPEGERGRRVRREGVDGDPAVEKEAVYCLGLGEIRPVCRRERVGFPAAGVAHKTTDETDCADALREQIRFFRDKLCQYRRVAAADESERAARRRTERLAKQQGSRQDLMVGDVGPPAE
eukprot:scaffold15662_cov109-Isochrysis_galbana.AAC.5